MFWLVRADYSNRPPVLLWDPNIPHSVQSLHGEFREDSVVDRTKSPLNVARISGRYVCEDTSAMSPDTRFHLTTPKC